MMPQLLMLLDALDNLAAWVAFCFVVLGSFAMALIVLLFACLALRAIWRWLTGNNWNSAIASAEHRAVRTR